MTKPKAEYWVTFRCVSCGVVIESERVVESGEKGWNFDAHEKAQHREDHPKLADDYGYVYGHLPNFRGECR